MMISIFFLVALIALASFATPGTAPIGILLLLFLFVGAVWWVGLTAITRGAPVEALTRVRRHELLGPGGPDDPFANEPYADELVPAFAATERSDAPREEASDT